MAKHLTDMKLPKRSKDKGCEVACDSPDEPRYPYGLEISLDNDALDKLGLELPEAGEQFIVLGVGPVTRVSQTDNKRGKDRSLTIQLQKIEVGPVKTGKIKSAVDAVSAGIKQADET